MVWVQFTVKELRSHRLQGTAKKKKKKIILYSEIMDLLDSLVLKDHLFHERVMLLSGLLTIKA